MKKFLALVIALTFMFALVACDNKPAETTAPETTKAPETTGAPVDPFAKSEGVMTYAEYDAAATDTAVVIEAYVQAKQSWWDNKATVYAQDKDGAYFIYNMACSEADYAKLVPGTKIKVSGFKSEWSGEIEITDATFEIGEGSFIADAQDVTALLGTDELVKNQNKFVSFKDMKVEAAGKDADGKEVAYLYKYNGSGADGDDLYFNVSNGGKIYTFTVESYLCDKTTDVYNAVKSFKIGEVVDLEGFLYWYNGVNPHITSVIKEAKSEGVMTYAEYSAAATDTAVVIEAYVQAKQSWWDNKATVYAQDKDGAYFLYSMACTEEDFAKLTPGTKIRVSGYKSEWSGEIEITDATFEIIPGSFIATPTNVTSLLGTDALISRQNELVSFKNMTVTAAGQDADGKDVAYLYKYNGSGKDGDDLYFNVSLDGKVYTFTVESYLCDNTTEVYSTVKSLNIGDVVDMEGFLYWYNGVNPHITSVVIQK